MEKEAKIIEDFSESKLKNFLDHTEEKVILPQAHVKKFYYGDNSWVCIRPSGTEPTLKVYMKVRADSNTKANARLNDLYEKISLKIEEIKLKDHDHQ